MPRVRFHEGRLPDGALIRDVLFDCPGCGIPHVVRVQGASPWEFNWNVDLPTISPSILARWEEGEKRTPKVCHSYVREGRIQFLSDCTHALAGQTVDLPEVTSGA